MKHRIYRTPSGKEVILDHIASYVKDEAGRQTDRVECWRVRAVSGTPDNVSFGTPYTIAATELSSTERTCIENGQA